MTNNTPQDQQADLIARSTQALKWNYLGVAVRVFLQFAVQIVLARLIGPDEFGIVAVAVLVFGLGNVIAELGLGAALIQRHVVEQADIDMAFTRVVVSGTVIAGAIGCTATNIATLFGSPHVAPVLYAFCAAIVIQALGVVPAALLRRELDFKSVQLIQTASYVAGFVIVGVGGAVLGAGLWALVAAWLTMTSASTVLAFWQAQPGLSLRFAGGRSMALFGAKALIANLASWVIENVDNLIVGRLFGTRSLGLYGVTYNLVRNPTNHLVTSIQSVVFRASARANREGPLMADAYLALLAIVLLVVLPVFSGVAVASDAVILALFGAQWGAAVPLLVPLSLAMPLHAIAALSGPVLWGRGRVGREMSVQLFAALFLALGVTVASMISLVAVGWVVFLTYFIRAAWLSMSTISELQISPRRFARAMVGGWIAAAAVTVATATAENILASLGVGAALRLLIDSAAALCALVITALGARTLILAPELRQLALQMRLDEKLGRWWFGERENGT